MTSIIPIDVLNNHIICIKHREEFGIESDPHEDRLECWELPCYNGCRRKKTFKDEI